MISECFCTLSDLVAIPLCIAGQIELCMRCACATSLIPLRSVCFRVVAAQSPERLGPRWLAIRQISRQTATVVSSGVIFALLCPLLCNHIRELQRLVFGIVDLLLSPLAVFTLFR